jgi:hypothetical protein
MRLRNNFCSDPKHKACTRTHFIEVGGHGFDTRHRHESSPFVEVHCDIYPCPPLVPVLSWIPPVHVVTAYFLRAILLLPSRVCLGFPCDIFSSGFITYCTCMGLPFLLCMLLVSLVCSMFSSCYDEHYIKNARQ